MDDNGWMIRFEREATGNIVLSSGDHHRVMDDETAMHLWMNLGALIGIVAIREAARTAGVRALALKAQGLSPATVSRFIRGKEISLTHFLAIANALSVSLPPPPKESV